MSKHTPGPWTQALLESGWGVGSPKLKNRCILFVPKTDDGAETIPSEANARLIAAAPELLEACKSALDYLQKSDSFKDGHAYPTLIKAIAKAEEE